MSNTRVTWNPVQEARVQLEWVKIGAYWQDAANTGKYDGHNLINLRTNWDVRPDFSLSASIANLTDRRYADSSSISSGVPVYSPGLPRTLYVGGEFKW
jgi:outer membrane receptor protein involved in Fe transport